MEPAAFTSTLTLIDAAMWAGVVFPERLPSIATQLLSDGADTPTLRLLAGLDLAPFDSRDARDLFRDLVEENSVQSLPVEERVEAVAHLVAVAHQQGRLTTAGTLRRFHRLALAGDYPDHCEVMYLYGLEDEWQGGWGRTVEQIETDAQEMTGRLAKRLATPLPVLVDAVSNSE